MLEYALIQKTIEGEPFGQTEIENSRKILRSVREEVGAAEAKEWVRRTIVLVQQEEVLQPGVQCKGEEADRLQGEQSENMGRRARSCEETVPGDRCVCGLREARENGDTPHRRELLEQRSREFSEIMQKLSCKETQEAVAMYCLRTASESEESLLQALSTIQEREAGADRPVPYTLKIRSGCEGGGKGALIQDNKSATLSTNNDQYLFQPVAYDARGNGDGQTVSTLTGDHENRITDYTSVVVEKSPVYCLQGNGIDRADTAGCNGYGWHENLAYTLNTIDRHAVCYPQVARTLTAEADASHCIDRGQNVVSYDARGNGDGTHCPTLTGDHENRCTDYTALCIGHREPNSITMANQANTLTCMHDQQAVLTSGKPPRKYIIRRLTPLECCRLQGFPDGWGIPDHKDRLSNEELEFWQGVRDTCASIAGKPPKKYSAKSLTRWYNALHTDSAEYKMWGNGIALPCAAFVLGNIAKHSPA